VRVEPAASLGADAAPLADQQGAAEQGRARPPSGSSAIRSAPGGSAPARPSPRTAAAGSVSAEQGQVCGVWACRRERSVTQCARRSQQNRSSGTGLVADEMSERQNNDRRSATWTGVRFIALLDGRPIKLSGAGGLLPS
jgi:hypothetical protein